MRHVTTPKRFIYASVSMDSTEMGLGVLVSNKFMKCHALFRPDVRESALRDMFSCRIRNPGNLSFGIWNCHDSGEGGVIFAIPIQSLSQPRPQGFFLKKMGGAGLGLREKPWGRGWSLSICVSTVLFFFFFFKFLF